MKVFKEKGYEATVKELNKNLTGKIFINIMPARSFTHDVMKMSLAYLMFLKRRGLTRSRSICVPTEDHIENTSPNSDQISHV